MRSFSIRSLCILEHLGNEHFSSGNLALTLTHALLTFSENTFHRRVLSNVSKNCPPLVQVCAGAYITVSFRSGAPDPLFRRGHHLEFHPAYAQRGRFGGNKSNSVVTVFMSLVNHPHNTNLPLCICLLLF